MKIIKSKSFQMLLHVIELQITFKNPIYRPKTKLNRPTPIQKSKHPFF